MIYQNFKSDFSIVESFKHPSGQALPVPDHVRIDYFVRGEGKHFVVERNGDKCVNCAVSEDGLNLIAYISLSRSCLGMGVLVAVVTEIVPNEAYPSGEMHVSIPKETGITLYAGESADSDSVDGQSVLRGVVRGYSAYEIAVQNGFEGTEAEWLSSLNVAPVEYGGGKDSVVQKWGGNSATGERSSAFGTSCTATGMCSHAEGHETESAEHASHSEGYQTKALGWASHAEGVGTIAQSHMSHAEGDWTQTSNDTEHAEGRFNKTNVGTRHSVGIGTSGEDRKNAHEIMEDGRHFIYGIGGYNGTNPGTSGDLVAVLTALMNRLSAIPIKTEKELTAKNYATESYVAEAIANAITVTLNTEV